MDCYFEQKRGKMKKLLLTDEQSHILTRSLIDTVTLLKEADWVTDDEKREITVINQILKKI